MNKLLVTSGCSFSDNFDKRWPHFLAERLNRRLINYGYGSAGNDHICNSMIFAINNLLKNGTKFSDIKAVVMWSGIDRQGHFISKNETHNYENLINSHHTNPANFTLMTEIPSNSGRFVPLNKDIDSGWLLGSPNCSWENENITKYKRLYFENFYTYEGCLFNSLNNFLQLQWFCENKGIEILNLTFKGIFPDVNQYSTVKHLYDMIDFNKWKFWDENKGLYEYTKDNNLTFYNDNFHPLPESHQHYVDNFLLKDLVNNE